MDSRTLSTDRRSARRSDHRPSMAQEAAGPGKLLSAISGVLDRLRHRSPRSPGMADVLRLRALMASVAADATADESSRASVSHALAILDAVLDSPLDLDASLFETIHSTLVPTFQDRTAELAREMREMNRRMRQQAQRLQPGRSPNSSHPVNDERPEASCPPSPAPAADRSASPVHAVIRGFHVRQAGHDFVLPVNLIEGAFAVDVDSLPTVCGKAVAHYCGELCDVIRLASFLGLASRGNLLPKTLMVIAESGARVCLALDEVVGPVEAAVTPMASVLPQVTGLTGVAVLKSGRLALVPDLSRLLSDRVTHKIATKGEANCS